MRLFVSSTPSVGFFPKLRSKGLAAGGCILYYRLIAGKAALKQYALFLQPYSALFNPITYSLTRALVDSRADRRIALKCLQKLARLIYRLLCRLIRGIIAKSRSARPYCAPSCLTEFLYSDHSCRSQDGDNLGGVDAYGRMSAPASAM